MTYENICLLRSQSGNGRVDYSGDCLSVPGAPSVEAVCSNIREKARCRFTAENCRNLVIPEEGCCPICGKLLQTSSLTQCFKLFHTSQWKYCILVVGSSNHVFSNIYVSWPVQAHSIL